jgi:protein TonB
MNANQILSADLLDLVFNDRNKAYGAYELRKSYDLRIKKALGITGLVLLLGVGGHLMAGTGNKPDKEKFKITSVGPTVIPIPDEPPPPPPPPPVVQPRVQTIQWTTPVIVDEAPTPPPTIADVVEARIDVTTTEGTPDDGIVKPSDVDGGASIIEQQVVKQDEIWGGPIEIDASFKGNWIKFLERNLRPDVPAENGAPPGIYRVVIQFVVDLEGKISDIKPLTNYGYGMEEEAIRVIKKADKWEPAVQNGRHVKTYRKQPITFKYEEN